MTVGQQAKQLDAGNRHAVPIRRSLSFRRGRITLVRLSGALVIALATLFVARPSVGHASEVCCDLPPRILVLRGVFEVFSLGMNDLAEKLRCCGYDAKSTSWSLALLEAKCEDQRPVVIVGHSLGGRACGWVPRKLRKCGKRVPLIIIVDANLILGIPSNVDRCVNLHVTNPVGIFHGRPVKRDSKCTHLVNWDISRGQPSMFKGGVNHFNIDATDWVHQIIINEIAATFPAPVVRKQRPDSYSSVQEHAAVNSSQLEGVANAPDVVSWSPHRPVIWQPTRAGLTQRSTSSAETSVTVRQ